jgi:hypothetical protein
MTVPDRPIANLLFLGPTWRRMIFEKYWTSNSATCSSGLWLLKGEKRFIPGCCTRKAKAGAFFAFPLLVACNREIRTALSGRAVTARDVESKEVWTNYQTVQVGAFPSS